MSSWAEVVEPSTRALVDDDSEDELPESQQVETLIRLELKLIDKGFINSCSKSIDVLIIAHGKLSTSFVERFVCEGHDLIALVQESHVKDTPEKKPLSVSWTTQESPIYRINKNTCLCVCADIDINNANKFRNAIEPVLQKSERIVVITAQKSSLYLYDKFGAELIVPFVRCLHSSSYKSDKMDVPYLEQPNFVTGVPAAVLSWCEVFNVPGILYCCYTDTNEVNSISTDPLIKIFSGLSTEILDPSKVEFKKESYGPVSSNLYL